LPLYYYLFFDSAKLQKKIELSKFFYPSFGRIKATSKNCLANYLWNFTQKDFHFLLNGVTEYTTAKETEKFRQIRQKVKNQVRT